jgi:hypothetical protein
MKNNFSKLIILGLILVIGGSIFTALAYAESGLSLIVNKECDIEYSGNSCKADLEMKNSTGEVLEGEVLLSIDYEGTCGTGSGPFDGEGITAQFLINEKTFNFSSEWDNGTTTVSGFDIKKDKTSPKLEINTVPNLCPGEYTYTLTIKGTSEGGEEYVTEPTPVGGGGGSSYNPPEEEKIIKIEDVSILEVISQETGEREEVLGWNTTDESNEPLATNGAVVYGTQSVFDNNLGPAPNYGYQFRQESEGKKENHTITLGNLQPGATYYYRIISWASPDTVSFYRFRRK